MIRRIVKEDLKRINILFNQFDYRINDNYLNNPFFNCLVYKDEIIKGVLIYQQIYDRIEIDYIIVDSKFQRQHIASKLLEYLINSMFSIKNITLEVNEENVAAINLYKKFNFKEVARRKNYYKDKDAILMIRRFDNVKEKYILGIETSCDETSVSIVKNGIDEVATVVLSQMDTHANYGGVVPEIASRMHLENITIVINECLKKAKMEIEDIDAIAVTYAPGLIGCLLVGVTAANTLSYIHNKPLIPVHHIIGHIYANNLKKRLEFPLIALVVSGAHTELVYMEKDYKFQKIGGTLDDAVGEAYDKVARIINLPYPGGPLVDKLAFEGSDTYDLPIPLDDNSYNFSFSGIKSAVINLVHNEKQRGSEIRPSDLACSFQNRVVDILVKKTMKAVKEYNVDNLIVAGGVSANKGLREKLKKACDNANINLSMPDIKYCTDNGAMIASAGYYAYQEGIISDIDLKAKPNDNMY